jgi:hypothetical protein
MATILKGLVAMITIQIKGAITIHMKGVVTIQRAKKKRQITPKQVKIE